MQPIVVPKHIWVKLLLSLPADDKLFSHDDCTGCARWDGTRLRASTIAHIGHVLADAADPDGTNIYRGVMAMARGAKRDRKTVIAAMGHLQTVGLLVQHQRGGGRGRRRGGPSVYNLSVPSYDVLTAIGVDVDALMRTYEHLQQIPAPHDWFRPAASTPH